MSEEKSEEIVFGTPLSPSKPLAIEAKKPRKKRTVYKCGERDAVTQGFIWICQRPRKHKGEHKFERIPRVVPPAHPEKESSARIL